MEKVFSVPGRGNGLGSGGGGAFFECGEKGHIKQNFPKLKKGDGNARGWAFVIGNKDAIQGLAVITCMFIINN